MEDEGSGWSVAFETAKSVAYLGQGSTIQFFESCILFLGSLFFPRWLFGQMESINVAGVLQEAGNANWRSCTGWQV